MILSGNADQLRPVICHQLFIGGAHTLARKQCLSGKLIGRMQAAHRLTDHSDFRIVHNDIEIMHHLILIRISREIPQIQNILDIQFRRRSLVNGLLVRLDYLDNTAAHRSVP